jgi:predicted aspartyl protease
MPIIKYDFLPDIAFDPKVDKLKTIYRPYALVKLGNENKWSKNFIKALIDSGADYNVFPSSFADEIGIDCVKGELQKITGVGGLSIDTYVHFVRIKVENKEFETVVQFGKDIQTPLLGREGFFNYFDYAKFNVKRRFLEMKY